MSRLVRLFAILLMASTILLPPTTIAQTNSGWSKKKTNVESPKSKAKRAEQERQRQRERERQRQEQLQREREAQEREAQRQREMQQQREREQQRQEQEREAQRQRELQQQRDRETQQRQYYNYSNNYSSNYNYRSTEPHFNERFGPLPGFRCLIDMSYAFGDAQAFQTSLTLGSQIKRNIFVGAGIAIQGSTSEHVSVGLAPIYGCARFEFGSHRVTPFLDGRIGYAIGADGGPSGFYLNPSLGLRFATSRRFAINAFVGMNYQNLDYEYSTKAKAGFSLGAGIDF